MGLIPSLTGHTDGVTIPTEMSVDHSKLPEKFWHCLVHYRKPKVEYTTIRVSNDLTIEELLRDVVEHWQQGHQFIVGGVIVKSRDHLDEIHIVQTPNPLQYYIEQNKGRNVLNQREIPFWTGIGIDHTSELLGDESAAAVAPEADVGLVLRVCERLPRAASILTNRSRKEKQPYTIEDEYDVQDLLHAVIRAYVKYSVQEDPIGKVAAARSSRADISIEDLGVLVEVKYVRGPEDQKRIVNEHSQDLVLYAKWVPLRRLILLVYNSGVLRDREALEQLAGGHKVGGRTFKVDVVLA